MIKYVVFDFDGTLADSKQAIISSWNQLAIENNFRQIELKDLETLKHLSITERGEKMNFPMHKLPFVLPKFYKLFRKSIHEVELFPGIQQMLQELENKGYKIAIISSNAKENIEAFLAKNNITNVSSIHCSSSIFGKDKLINKFLKRNKLTPSEIIYVGDEKRDIVACKKANVKVIWVSWGYDSHEAVEKEEPDFLAYTPEEILQLID
ncbi:MAG: HAD-IA family hydrolase [Bacillus sp. (in: Bacteria)]|nr:HAD-IA family hydrolase [Bacillus sp. (in: firmicutes)]